MAKSSSTIVSGLNYLSSPEHFPVGKICAVVGEDAFLRQEVRQSLTHGSTDSDEELTLEIREGKSAEWRNVVDLLRERSLFGGGSRTVIVEDADPFVKNYREKIEQYVEESSGEGLLVLELNSLPGNTRLAKAVAKHGLTIRCSVPDRGKELTEFVKSLKMWLVDIAHRKFEVDLQKPAVDLLLDLLPTEVGILYQEVAKLSLLASDDKKIGVELVREHVGSWRTRKTWDMIDAVADGNAADALRQLDRLIAAGEEPHALLPQMASTLRKFAAAARQIEQAERRQQRVSLQGALKEAGIIPFKAAAAEQQLRQIGRPRAKQLNRWLLAADLALKSHNSTKDRARRELETLVVRLSKQAFKR